jgi:hypothetical protein
LKPRLLQKLRKHLPSLLWRSPQLQLQKSQRQKLLQRRLRPPRKHSSQP